MKPTDDTQDTRTAYWGEVAEPSNDVVRPEFLEFQPPPDQPVQARDALTKTALKARIIPNKVVMSASGAQYERWKQATSKELQAFLGLLWKGPTSELRALFCSQEQGCRATPRI